MDFVYDLKDKLDEQNTESLIMIVKNKKEEAIIDTFYNIKYPDTQQTICACMTNLCKKWSDGEVPKGDITISAMEEEEELSDWGFEFELNEDEDEDEDKKTDDEDKK